MSEYANSNSAGTSQIKGVSISRSIVNRGQDLVIETRMQIDRIEERISKLFFVEHLPQDPKKELSDKQDVRQVFSGEMVEIHKAHEDNLARLRQINDWLEQFI